MVKPNVLLIGCGKMGGALLRRWQELNLYKEICVVEPAPIPLLQARQVPEAAQIPKTFRPDVLVVAVKPQTLPEMLRQY